MWVGRTCGIVRACVFVPVGDGPINWFFYAYHTTMSIISLLYCGKSIVGVFSFLWEMALIFCF